jgi:hypothetical protein
MFHNIIKAFEQKKAKGWDKLYWAIDLHDTIIEGKYNFNNEGAEIFPFAAEVLSYLSSRKDMCLILWTSSHDQAYLPMAHKLEEQYGIKFNYFNENPEVKNTHLCDFSQKLYFNILLDDKAGFNGLSDWRSIRTTLKMIGEWKLSGKYKIDYYSRLNDLYVVSDAEDEEHIGLYRTNGPIVDAFDWINKQGGVYVP